MSRLFLERSPLPGIALPFLITGPAFGLLAALLLLVHGDAVLINRWVPVTLAVVHLLTLGFLGTTMLGALLQVTAVTLGRGIPLALPWAQALYGFFVAGTLCLVAGFLTQSPLAFRFAIVLLLGTLPVFFAAVMRRVWGELRRRDTARALGIALLALGVLALLGLRLASGWGWHELGIPRQWTDLHLRFGLFGWVGVLVMAVSFEVVPMFQFTPPFSMRERKWLPPGILIALLLCSLLMLAGRTTFVADLLLFMPLALFAIRLLFLQRRSRRRDSDCTRRFFRFAMVSLLLSGLLWLAAGLSDKFGPRLAMAATALYLLGFALGCVNGMLYKIVPFLLTLRLQRRRWAAGARALELPRLRDFIRESVALRQYRLSLIGTAGVVLAVLFPGVGLARLAAILLLAAWLQLLVNLVGALRLFDVHRAPEAPCPARYHNVQES